MVLRAVPRQVVLKVFLLWQPDLTVADYERPERINAGNVGGNMGVDIHAKQWLDYKVELIEPMMNFYFPWLTTGLWKCRITYTRAEMICDEVRVHEAVGIIPDLVQTPAWGINQAGYGYGNGTQGDARYGELAYFTYDVGHFHFSQPAYMDAMGGWGTFYYQPTLHPDYPTAQCRFPNGNYTVSAKVRYRTIHADFETILDIDAPSLFGPGGGGSGGSGSGNGDSPPFDPPPGGGSNGGTGGGDSGPPPPHPNSFSVGRGASSSGARSAMSPLDVLLPGSGGGDGYDRTPSDAPWQELTVTCKVNLLNMVVDGTKPANPTPIVWDPDTMKEFPLQVHMQSAYKSWRMLDVLILNTQGQAVHTARKTFIGQSDLVDFHWDGYQTDPGGNPTTQLPRGLYFFTCTAHLPEYDDEWGDKSQFMRITVPAPEATQVSDDGQTSTYELQYKIMCNGNLNISGESRPASEGVIDVYGPNLKKIYSHPMTAAELALGQHTIHLSMPTHKESGVYTFVITPRDDYADLDKRHLCQYPMQASQVVINWEIVSGTYVGNRYFYSAPSNMVTSMKFTFINDADNTVLWTKTLQANFLPFGQKPILWDTTHFPNGTKIRIQVTADTVKETPDGHSFSKTFYFQVYNSAYTLANTGSLPGSYPFRHAVSNMRDAAYHLQRVNYTVQTGSTDVKGSVLTPGTIMYNLPAFTVFYAYTHGQPGGFDDCLSQNLITSQDVASAMLQKFNPLRTVLGGTRGKPFPDFSFVFVDACEAGRDSSLAKAFKVSNTPDRAFVGWKTSLLDNPNNYKWLKNFWDALDKGKTVKEAQRFADKNGRPILSQSNGVVKYAVLKIYGDLNTKIHGAYGLKDSDRLIWHNPAR